MSKRDLNIQALRARSKRPRFFGLGVFLLLPVLVPAAFMVAAVLAFVARTVLTVAFEVSAGLVGGLGWLVWPIAGLLLISMLKRSRRRIQLPEIQPQQPPPPAAPPVPTEPVAPLAELALHTCHWLGEQLSSLPVVLQGRIHSMQSQLSALVPQLQDGRQDALANAELEKVLREELPELIQAYRKVPRALQQRSLHGGSSPEQQLSAGLSTLDAQLGALHERLAAPDLQALAVHQRYLDLKYNPPGSGSS